MIVRKFKRHEYATIKESLCNDAQFNSYDGSYIIIINKIDYILKVQFPDDCRLIVWSAAETTHTNDGEKIYKTIIVDNILFALLNIMLWQKTQYFKKETL